MRLSSICLALGAAQLAICAPTAAGVVVERRNNAPDTVGNVVTGQRTWTTYLDENEAAGRDRHDPRGRNRPESPLPPLSKHRTHKAPSPRPDREPPKVDVIHIPHPDSNEADVLELLDLEAARPPRPGMPCHHDPSPHERNDMLVVFLVAAFLAVVVVMETGGRLFRRQGAIRLEETSDQPPVSVQANPQDEDRPWDEKRRL